MKIIKQIEQLGKEDIQKIFFSAFPNVDEVFTNMIEATLEYNSNVITDDTIKRLRIELSLTGYCIVIYDNYDIELDSNAHPINRIKVPKIFKTLIEVGAISIDC